MKCCVAILTINFILIELDIRLFRKESTESRLLGKGPLTADSASFRNDLLCCISEVLDIK